MNFFLGVNNRGVSNSIASPGVSALFGGGPSYTTANSTETAKVPTKVESTVPVRTFDVQAETVGVNRFANQDTQNFRRSQSSEQMNSSSMKFLGNYIFNLTILGQRTSAETNKRRLEQPSQIAEVADVRFSKMEKLMARTYQKDTTGHKASERTPEVKTGHFLQTLKQSYKEKGSTLAKLPENQDIPPTEIAARLIYRNHLEDIPTATDIATAVQAEQHRSQAELAVAYAEQQRLLDYELANQVDQRNRMKQAELQEVRAAHQASPGFDFEFYSRHPRMLEEAKKTGKFVREQLSETDKRRLCDLEESRKLPENFLTAEQYQEVLRANQRELLEAKKTCEQDLKIDYDRATRESADKSQNEQEQKLQDERNRNLEIQRMIEYDNHMKKMQIQQRNAEMNQVHSKTIFSHYH